MPRLLSLLFFILLVNFAFGGNPKEAAGSLRNTYSVSDTIKESQILFNGKAWRNKYFRVKGNQYLFSTEFLRGDLTINGKSFENLELRYDIYNDEIMTVSNNGSIIQLNKELVDSFSLTVINRKYRFINSSADSVKWFHGYLNLLYRGKSDLCVKYMKDIELLAVDRKFDLFNESHKIFFVTDSIVYPVNRVGDIYKAVPGSKSQLKSFVKKNKFLILKKNPESFIPLIRYYDSIKN